jgi:glycosyltransferase involved in cell wall biosynthesis
MNILCIGPSPVRAGGVGFYQRALATQYQIGGLNVYFVGVDQINHALERSFIEETQHDNQLLKGRVFDLIMKTGVYFGAIDPIHQVSEASAEEAIAHFITLNKIEVVHFHASRPASLIHVAKHLGCRVVVSLHDYWFLCSLGFRVTPNRHLCEGSCGTKCSITCDSFSRDREEYITRNSINSNIRGTIKYVARRVLGNMYPTFQKYLQRNGSSVLPAVHAVTAEADLSPVRASNSVVWAHRQQAIINTLNESADVIISVSKIVTKRHVEAGVMPDKIMTLNSGFEHSHDEFFALSRATSRPISDNLLRIVFVSPLYPEKGLHVLIQAVKLLEHLSHKFQLDIYGKKEEWSSNYWTPLINDLGSNISFHGTFDYKDLPKIYSRADVAIVCPIMEDPSPRVVWEALAAGVPVIASRQSGAADFITQGVNGILFNSNDAKDLAKEIMPLIEDLSVIKRLQQGIVPLKSIEEHARELIAIYRE